METHHHEAQHIAPEVIQVPVPVKEKSNTSLIVTLVILTIVGFSLAAGFAGYMIAKGNVQLRFVDDVGDGESNPTADVGVACTMDAKICPDGSAVGRIAPNCEFAACPEVSVVVAPTGLALIPTMVPSTNGNTFRSAANRFSFYYGTKLAGGNQTISVLEQNNRVYVYPTGNDPLSGQFVETWTKSPSDSLAQAITKQFLNGISVDTCFVEKMASTESNVEKAIISYPVPPNSDEPFFMFGDACPAGHSKSNGMAYFYYDTRVPDRYFYFSIGQYGIPAYTNDDSVMWQSTFSVY